MNNRLRTSQKQVLFISDEMKSVYGKYFGLFNGAKSENKDRRDRNIMAGNDQRMKLHNLNNYLKG